MDFSQEILSNYQKEANKKLAAVCRHVNLAVILIIVAGLTGIYEYPSVAYPVLFISIGILLLPTVFYDWCKFNSDFIRYCVLGLLVLTSGVIYSIFSYQVMIIAVIPAVVACLYRLKRWVLFTSGVTIPVMIGAHYLAYWLDIYPEPIADTPLELLTAAIIPRLVLFLTITLVCIGITECFNDMVTKMIDNNNIMYRDQESLISSLSTMIEMQSQETGQHVRRVSEYTKILCRALGINENETWKIGMASMMHDVGKIAVPKEILEKPGKLTDEEFVVIKRHIFYGKEILEQYPGEIMQLSAIIAYQHHEHFDGSGYMGLKGEEISREAQCVALADFFDALVSKRSYKAAWSPEQARTEILAQKNKYFDPYIVNLFDIHFVDFLEIYRMYPD